MKLTLLSRCMRALLPRCVRTKVRWRPAAVFEP